MDEFPRGVETSELGKKSFLSIFTCHRLETPPQLAAPPGTGAITKNIDGCA